MTEGKHTPGPWQDVAGKTSGKKVITLAAVAKAKHIVAHVGGPDRGANARLISAAPDLLEALEMLCKRFDTFGGQPYSNPKGSAWDKARTAIAKATGGAA